MSETDAEVLERLRLGVARKEELVPILCALLERVGRLEEALDRLAMEGAGVSDFKNHWRNLREST